MNNLSTRYLTGYLNTLTCEQQVAALAALAQAMHNRTLRRIEHERTTKYTIEEYMENRTTNQEYPEYNMLYDL